MQSNETTQASRGSGEQFSPGIAALWASAFVIIAMIITQAGSVVGGNQAHATMEAEILSLRMLISRANTDEMILTILNNQNETITAYGVRNQRDLEALDVRSLADIFREAAAASGK